MNQKLEPSELAQILKNDPDIDRKLEPSELAQILKNDPDIDRKLEPRELAEIATNNSYIAEVATNDLDIAEVAETQAIYVWLSSYHGKTRLNWRNTGALGKWDYVALFREYPGRYDALKYVFHAWDWVYSQQGTYITGATGPQRGWYCGYCVWDYGEGRYIVIARRRH